MTLGFDESVNGEVLHDRYGTRVPSITVGVVAKNTLDEELRGFGKRRFRRKWAESGGIESVDDWRLFLFPPEIKTMLGFTSRDHMFFSVMTYARVGKEKGIDIGDEALIDGHVCSKDLKVLREHSRGYGIKTVIAKADADKHVPVVRMADAIAAQLREEFMRDVYRSLISYADHILVPDFEGLSRSLPRRDPRAYPKIR